MTTAPLITAFPSTPAGWCDYFRTLDQKFRTDRHSPLHHDNRCELHRCGAGTLTANP